MYSKGSVGISLNSIHKADEDATMQSVLDSMPSARAKSEDSCCKEVFIK